MKAPIQEPEGFAQLPSREYLLECFRFDASSGELYWLERPLSHFKDSPQRSAKWKASYQNGRCAGKKALTANNGNGHRGGILDGRKTYAHRVIWKIVYGEEPDTIDHIDGNPSNNRIENLRSVSHQENLRNTKLSKANTSGTKGVSRHPLRGFNARIHDLEGRALSKWFKEEADAIAWRASKESEFGYSRRAPL